VERRLAGDQEETVEAAPVSEVSRCRAHLQLTCVCFSSCNFSVEVLLLSRCWSLKKMLVTSRGLTYVY
jgi:hypothetical protein